MSIPLPPLQNINLDSPLTLPYLKKPFTAQLFINKLDWIDVSQLLTQSTKPIIIDMTKQYDELKRMDGLSEINLVYLKLLHVYQHGYKHFKV